jgi:Na+-transporting NADH:ubiquinone oxidoreductase subunit NqrC
MRARMPLNERGSVLVVVLLVTTVVAITAITTLAIGDQKRKLSRQMNVGVVAGLIKQKLVGMVLAPDSWQATQTNNPHAFTDTGAGGQSPQSPMLDIYLPQVTQPYYQASNSRAGFDAKGNACNEFSNEGNDACPFRYEITVLSHTQQNGNWIDKLHFHLLFRPRSKETVLNAESSNYTFDLVRNLDDRSIESACVSVNGVYHSESNDCSVTLTKAVTSCPTGQTYRGPATDAQSSNCAPRSVATQSCSGSNVIKGFDSDRNPICGAPL